MITLGKLHFSVMSQMTTQSEKKWGENKSPKLQVHLVFSLHLYIKL